MAGPCVDIFVPQKVSSSDELRVRAVIESMASTIEGNDFWIAQRPFFVQFEEPEPEAALLVLNGWSPKATVSLCAMTNTYSDHVLLAVLCYRTAQLLDGLIVLDDISTITNDPSVLTFEGTRPVDDYGYIVSPEFLGYWLSHPDFRLVK